MVEKRYTKTHYKNAKNQSKIQIEKGLPQKATHEHFFATFEAHEIS